MVEPQFDAGLTMPITAPHILPQDVIIVPVLELDPEVRSRIVCEDTDYAVTRPRARTPSKIVDSRAGELLKGFASPRTIVDVILEFSSRHHLEPESLLLDAFPVLQRFVDVGILVEEGSPHATSIIESFGVGDRVANWTIMRCLQVLEDVELYQVRDDLGHIAALKFARQEHGRIRATLDREAKILGHLAGVVSPRLLSSGEHEGLAYLVMEWRTGVSADTSADELRDARSPEARRTLLSLCHNITVAYATLHACGVLHGDVHERNILVDASGGVTVIDFGLSRLTTDDPPTEASRGGVPTYFEPELAAACLGRGPAPPVTAAGEQFSLGALLYQLLTGTTYVDFAADEAEAFRQIISSPVLHFAQRGVAPQPALERVLVRALAKDPANRFASVAELADSFQSATRDSFFHVETIEDPAGMTDASSTLVASTLEQLQLDGELFSRGVLEPPTANVQYGAAGIAYALYRIAAVREEPELLSLADIWISRALDVLPSARALYSPKLGLTRASVGPTSLYHTTCGIHVVRALVARAMGDFVSVREALAAFIGAARRHHDKIDLTLGSAGVLLGCALLREAIPFGTLPDVDALVRFGNRTANRLAARVRHRPPIAKSSDPLNLGIAHGWAGVLYALLRWHGATTRSTPDEWIIERLQQLAACAEPDARGLRWPWIGTDAVNPENHGYMSGWCNGSAGFVHLWLTASQVVRDDWYRELALGAGWNAWEEEVGHSLDLCCGFGGRAYAMLALYRDTGDREWLSRAQTLASLACDLDEADDAILRTNSSLYKGSLGCALLAAELEYPEVARMPLFESEGWPALQSL